jgi:energy-converting hydrogenase A subunit M
MAYPGQPHNPFHSEENVTWRTDLTTELSQLLHSDTDVVFALSIALELLDLAALERLVSAVRQRERLR